MESIILSLPILFITFIIEAAVTISILAFISSRNNILLSNNMALAILNNDNSPDEIYINDSPAEPSKIVNLIKKKEQI